MGVGERLGDMVRYSGGLLVVPLLCVGLTVLQGKWKNIYLALGIGYLALILGLVGSGQLTGSPRYYLAVVPLLLWGSQSGLKRWTVSLGVVLSVALSFYYLQLWPQWVILNRPSVQAGQWLAQQSHQGFLYTDSPVVAFYSQWPLTHIRGTGAILEPQAPSGYIVLVGDRRYQKLFPALERRTITPPLQDYSQDWTVRYGAKPVQIFKQP